jgi:hypothetical protein
MLPGETILSGASLVCDECGDTPYMDVYKSNAGYYVGTWCKCGPYSRESGYYSSYDEANSALITCNFDRV